MAIRIEITLPTTGRFAKQIIESAVEVLARADFAYLVDNPDTPTRQTSGVRYQREGLVKVEQWQTIPDMLKSGVGDCEDLAAWEIAQLRRRGIRALPHVTQIKNNPGKWHIMVRAKLPGGQWYISDPSRESGM